MARPFDLRMQAEFEDRYDPSEYVFLARGAAAEAALLAMPGRAAAAAVAELPPDVLRDYVITRLYEQRYWEPVPSSGSTKWADALADTYQRALLEEALE